MKAHFIYPDIQTWVFPTVHHGLASLAGALKANNHEVSLQHIKAWPKRNNFLRQLKSEKPDIICFTSTTNQYCYLEELAKWVKQDCDIPIIAGGKHPTLLPEEVIKNPHIDMVCIGEGEYALLELCNNLKEGLPVDRVKNLWVKAKDEIIKNPIGDLVDLEQLPLPEYEIFDKATVCWKGTINLLAGRGCPYDCSYCCNHALKEIFTGKGSYVRFREVDGLLLQIEMLVKKFKARKLYFEDDIFTLKKSWLREFCEKYPKRFDLPFTCNGRINLMDEEMLEWLASANCCQVNYGLESGNERIRKEILNRDISNERIKYILKKTKEKKIKILTYNMIGIPFETADAIEDTIALNKEVEPDHMPVFYFYPYPKTRLYDLCKENGFLTDRNSTSYCEKSILNLPSISQKELAEKYNKFSALSMEIEIKSRYPYLTIIVRLMNKLLGGAMTRRIMTLAYTLVNI